MSMRCRMSRCPLVVAALLAIACLARAQEADEALAALREKLATLRELHAQLAAERAALRDDRKALQRQVRALKADLESSRDTLAAAEADVRERQQGLERTRSATQAAREQFQARVQGALQAADRVLANLRPALPGAASQSLVKTLAQRRRALARADTPSAQAEALASLLAQLAEALPASREVKVWNAPVILEGGARRVHAWQFRIGWVTAGFVAEDAQAAGLAGRGEPWQLLPGPERVRLQRIVALLRGREPPAVIPVPLRRAASEEPRP